MTHSHEPAPRPDTPEQRATPVQAQSVLDEVDRITAHVAVLPGLPGVPHNAANKKARWHDDIFFVRFPDGESHPDDPTVLRLAAVAWDNPDDTVAAFRVEQAVGGGLQLTRHLYPPTDQAWEETAASGEATENITQADDIAAALAVRAANRAADDRQNQMARRQERFLGLHLATAGEAEALLTALRDIEPAPATET